MTKLKQFISALSWRVPRLLKKSAHEQISLSSSNLRFKTFETSKYINYIRVGLRVLKSNFRGHSDNFRVVRACPDRL